MSDHQFSDQPGHFIQSSNTESAAYQASADSQPTVHVNQASGIGLENTQDTQSLSPDAILSTARALAAEQTLAFAGGVTPPQAWELVKNQHATLIDVRTAEERKFVGLIPEALHIAWMTGTSMTRNPRFVKEVEVKIKDKANVLLLLCRSGKRSAAAAEALSKAGFTNVFNILDGFEGEITAQQQRGTLGGWRFHGLPWIQD